MLGLAGTAVGGVVNLAAETSGAVFEPVTAGLRSIEGLQSVANGLEKINGLPMAAVKEMSSLTFKAMNMSGRVSASSSLTENVRRITECF